MLFELCQRNEKHDSGMISESCFLIRILGIGKDNALFAIITAHGNI